MQDESTEMGGILKSLPAEDLPREKLMRLGRARLTDEELIAIFLRTGIRGCNVLQLAGMLKRCAGSLAALGAMEACDIVRLCKGIGLAKAATLAAVFELGQRAVQERMQAEDMGTAEAVYQYLAGDLRYERQENMVALLLDVRHRLIRRVNVGKGTLSRVAIHPRDVFREAIKYNASSLILAHNHPSGDPSPSKADIELTKHIVQAGDLLLIRVLDHVIIGCPDGSKRKPYFSFFANNLMQ